MSRRMTIVDSHQTSIGNVPEWNARLLEDSPDSSDAIRYLRQIRDEGAHLRCECGLVFHTVERDDFCFLRRNPNQKVGCSLPCGIGQHLESLHQNQVFDEPVSRPPGEIGLVLNSRLIPPVLESRKVESPRPPVSVRNRISRFQPMFQALCVMLERTGLTGWSPDDTRWDWTTFWDRWYDILGTVRLLPGEMTAREIAWCPTDQVKGLGPGLYYRTSRNWDLAGRKPEAWVFFICERIDPEGIFEAHRLSPKAREARARRWATPWTPIRFQLKKEQVSVIGQTGPFLGFAVAALDERHQDITVRRLALQAVAAPGWPLPVSSGAERDVAFLLWRLGMPFEKPLFADEMTQPDFVLPIHKTIIEVRGRTTAERLELKSEIHRKWLTHFEYKGWQLLTYDIKNGQTISDFENALRSLR